MIVTFKHFVRQRHVGQEVQLGRAQESAGRDQVAGWGTVGRAGVVDQVLEEGANLTKCVVALTRAEAVAAGACSACRLATARLARSRVRQSPPQRVTRYAVTTPRD